MPEINTSAEISLVIGVVLSFIFKAISGIPILAFLILILAGLAYVYYGVD